MSGNETCQVYCVYPPSGQLFATGFDMVVFTVEVLLELAEEVRRVTVDAQTIVGAPLPYQFIT